MPLFKTDCSLDVNSLVEMFITNSSSGSVKHRFVFLAPCPLLVRLIFQLNVLKVDDLWCVPSLK